IRTKALSSASVLLGGSSVSVLQPVYCLVIADGDVAADSEFAGCIVVARGSVRSRGNITGSVVVAGGKVEFGKFRRNEDSVIRENQPKLLGWGRFFEIGDAGLEVQSVEGGVKVTKVADKQPPQKAGLRVGDEITAVDGKTFKDVEEFRRLLRRSTVLEKSKFTVRREGKALELAASFV